MRSKSKFLEQYAQDFLDETHSYPKKEAQDAATALTRVIESAAAQELMGLIPNFRKEIAASNDVERIDISIAYEDHLLESRTAKVTNVTFTMRDGADESKYASLKNRLKTGIEAYLKKHPQQNVPSSFWGEGTIHTVSFAF